jgi:hypothetical protein
MVALGQAQFACALYLQQGATLSRGGCSESVAGSGQPQPVPDRDIQALSVLALHALTQATRPPPDHCPTRPWRKWLRRTEKRAAGGDGSHSFWAVPRTRGNLTTRSRRLSKPFH